MNDRNMDEPFVPSEVFEPSEDADTRFMQQEATTIKNDMLCCTRCVHIWENSTAECAIYEQKPLSVLRGGLCPDLAER